MQVNIKQVLAEIRGIRELKWKRDYCRKHNLYRRGFYANTEDIRAAPEPTDADLGFPIETMTVHWDTGYITIELSALAKLPAAQRNKIYKLGGLKMEFTINVHVTGLDKAAEGLLALASAVKGKPLSSPAIPANGMTVNAAPTSAPAPANVTPFPVVTGPLPAPHGAPGGAAAYTADELAQPAAAWMDQDRANRMPLLLALNAEFGIQGLSQLPPERYGEYALRLRQLGVGI